MPRTTRTVTLELELKEVTSTGELCAGLRLGEPIDPEAAVQLTLEGALPELPGLTANRGSARGD